MRLGVYTDYVYTTDGHAFYAQRAFAVFLARLADSVDEMVIAGRLDPDAGPSHYRLTDGIRFVPLPHYRTLARPLAALPAMARSLRRLWQVLDEVDAVWVLGPYPLSYFLVALAALRRRRVFLGVRQDWPRYVASRHPHSPPLRAAALLMEAGWRAVARLYPVLVVGPDLARRYRRARRLLPVTVSMVEAEDIVSADHAAARTWDGDIQVLSVGRLETEKNPLLLADTIARLRKDDGRWRIVICGEGPLADDLRDRFAQLGVSEAADMRGYVPVDRGLPELYRGSHVFLHVSWTEGLPQVLFEAFAAGLPVVATAVGGVPDAAGDAALLVPPGDASAAADALAQLAEDVDLRRRLIERGLERVRHHTTDAECRRIAAFLSDES